jgi:hyperosmotically inducible protein
LICIIAACLLATACSSMLIGGANPGDARIGNDTRTEQQINEDAAISAAVRSRFKLDSAVAATGIGIATYLQTVTLSGTVGSFDIRDRAVSIAKSTDKVRSVNNQIQVNSNR